MALINRARILNFSYNNHARQINDEIFDFFGGENALLSMKNGGGKSVLTQLLMQPIVPKAKLMNRRMEDFFAGKSGKAPSYILLEWKLEGEGGYLLTGIAMGNVESTVRDQEERDQRIKYFTFTVHYKESHEMDLGKIALTKEEEGKRFALGFKDAKKWITSQARKSGGAVQVFGDGQRDEYRQFLASFNIDQDEWKTLIRKINESEGGLIEIFKDVKKSMNVLKEWMLPAVLEVIHKSSDDQSKLESMMENVVTEWIANESFLQKRSLYESFIDKIQVVGEDANALAVLMDKKEETAQQLAGLYGYLKREAESLEARRIAAGEQIRLARIEEEKIESEERSFVYYQAEESLGKWQKSLELRRRETEEKEVAFQEAKQDWTEQQAADVKRELMENQGILLGVEERIKANQNDEGVKQRLMDLGYSLKLSYGEKNQKLETEKRQTAGEKESRDQAREEWQEARNKLEKNQQNVQGQIGALKERIRLFNSEEEDVGDRLKFAFGRSMLGEIAPADIKNYASALEREKREWEEGEKNCLAQQAEIGVKEEEAEIALDHLRKGQEEAKQRLGAAETALQTYQEDEELLARVFLRYGQDLDLRFQRENSLSWMGEILRERERELRNSEFERKNLLAEEESLREGRYHASAKMIHWLEERKIEFQTGESYLKGRNAKQGKQVLENAPMLPFGFLFYPDEFERVKDEIVHYVDRSLVPIYTYQALNQKKEVAEGDADHSMMVVPYRVEALDKKGYPLLLDQLNKRQESLQEQIAHFHISVDQARQDFGVIESFAYEKESKQNLEGELRKGQEEVLRLNKALDKRDRERKNCRIRDRELIVEFERIGKEYVKVKLRETAFLAFLNRDKENCQDQATLETARRQGENLLRELEKGRAEEEGRNRLDAEASQKFAAIENEQGKVRRGLLRFQKYESGEVIDGSLDSLLGQWQSLQEKQDDSQRELEEKKVGLIEVILERKRKLATYHIPEERLKELVYQPERAALLQEKLEKSRKDLEDKNKAFKEADQETRKFQVQMDTARRELDKPGRELLPRPMIFMDFANRRLAARKQAEQERKIVESLGRELDGVLRLKDRISDVIDLSDFTVTQAEKPSLDPVEAYTVWRKELEKLKKEIEGKDRSLKTRFDGIWKTYCLQDDLPKRSVQMVWEKMNQQEPSWEDYIYVEERIEAGIKTIKDLIRILNERLVSLEKNQENLIRHSYMQGKKAYEELLKIEEHSAIRLEGEAKNRKMIRVRMEKMEETDADNWAKMEAYIKTRIAVTKLEMQGGKSAEEIKRMIHNQMDTFELLGVLTDLSQFEVQAYKIDLNPKNRGYKSWEKVVREHSGGERFVSFFALLVALMSYTRTSRRVTDNYRRNEDTKVLIMDNPFGPITSAHLLQPLFQIAKRYKTQLICLTDIKSNSVWDCFSVIYMLKIRTNALRNKEYVTVEQEVRDPDLKRESLEKATFYSNTEQIRLDL
jgi:hypothetical protein